MKLTVLSCNKLIRQLRYASRPACALTLIKFSPTRPSSKCGPFLVVIDKNEQKKKEKNL